MKKHTSIKNTVMCLTATAIMTAAAITTGQAAVALQGQVSLRPLTPQELKDYSLPTAQLASGLSTVGKGQPAYFDALVNIAVPVSDIVSVTWSLTNKPPGSSAALVASPLGANVPTYKIADRSVLQVAGRTMLIPDATGQYTVVATIVTSSSGSTNIATTITAANYMGINTCALCHSGGIVAPDTVNGWSQTLHAHAFEEAINGVSTDHFSKNCISCHVVGFDTNSLANNGGFDDIAASTGWVFPSTFNMTNYSSMPASLRNVSNIQCENCHGAGSEHAIAALSDVNLAKQRISVSMGAGDCSQCHDSLTHHFKSAEWNNSLHANATRTPSGPGREDCVRCHTAAGFEGFVDGSPETNTDYEAITCAACHDPHDATNPHQVRTIANVTLMDGTTTITNGGTGKLCMECHMSRVDAATYVETTAGSSRFGPHHGPQSDMLAGVNAVTYGKDIPSSAHRDVVKDSCVSCHMQEVTSGPGFTHVGGHTFNLAWDGGTPNTTTDDVEVVESCAQCHGPIETFNLKRQDYDGDGVVDGVQTEVKHLLDQLGTLLPPVGSPTVTVSSAYTKNQLKAAFNYQFVLEDGSYGVHNVSYAVGLLKASIADLTDDADHDGLSDKWEIANFGSITAYDGNADPDHDGVNNALELAAGTNPLLADSDSDGVSDLAELQAGSDPTNPLDTPEFMVHIYGAGELEFASQIGTTYQIQMITAMGTGWQTVSTNIPGTGETISRLISTRNGGNQAYYRVVKVAQ